MTTGIVKLFRAEWVIPVLCCLTALATTVAGALVLLGSVVTAFVTRDMSPMVAGLLGGSLLGSCGGIALVWSLGRMRTGV